MAIYPGIFTPNLQFKVSNPQLKTFFQKKDFFKLLSNNNCSILKNKFF